MVPAPGRQDTIREANGQFTGWSEPRSRLNVLYLETCNDRLGRRDEAVLFALHLFAA